MEMSRPNNLGSERVRLGLSKPELAEKIGVTRITVDNWEKDISPCSARFLLALTELFDCSADYLIGRTEVRK